jgi:prophage regulatory protein
MAAILLKLPEVRRRTALSRSEIYRKMAMRPPQFPQKIPLGRRAVAWVESEVSAWISERIAAGRPSTGDA